MLGFSPSPAAADLLFGTSMRMPFTSGSRILCAVDFSTPSRAAFERALLLARTRGAQLSLVFVVPRHMRVNRCARERVDLVAEFRRSAAAEGVSISTSVQQGDPAGIILGQAASRTYDAIVMGSHDRHGVDRLRPGSAAERVIARAPCPTLVVPAAAGAGVRDERFGHILCAVNVSPVSNNAVANALELLKHSGRKLTLLHVVRRDHARTARMRLQELIAASAGAHGRIHARLGGGPVASGILDIAAELTPDLIVLGITSRRRLRGWFEAVTTRIVRASTCSVLAIP